MADKLPRDDEPSFELPSLFRRGGRKSPAALAVGAAVGLGPARRRERHDVR